MRNKFLLEGETNEQVYVAVEFNLQAVTIQLDVFEHKASVHELLKNWVKNETDLPQSVQTFTRTVADENLLPEEIKVKEVGKVRQIEIEWGNLLIQSRLLKGFEDDLLLIKEKLATLENYSQELFDETDKFWVKLLEFKKEFNLPNEKVDSFKLEIDVIFEALKSLRKDSKKEFDENSIENYTALKAKLDACKQKIDKNQPAKNIINDLKEIRTEFNKTAMRKNHKQEIDETINSLFEQLSQTRKKAIDGKTNKRITDLEGILEKMNKSIDWELRELAKEDKNLANCEQKFQLKLFEAKIAMLKSKLDEKVAKRNDIQNTLTKLKEA